MMRCPLSEYENYKDCPKRCVDCVDGLLKEIERLRELIKRHCNETVAFMILEGK